VLLDPPSIEVRIGEMPTRSGVDILCQDPIEGMLAECIPLLEGNSSRQHFDAPGLVIEDQLTNAKTVLRGQQWRGQGTTQAIGSNLLAAVAEIRKQVIDSAFERLGALTDTWHARFMWFVLLKDHVEMHGESDHFNMGDNVIWEVILSTIWDEEESDHKGRETTLG
jgi:hypothetical protein